MVIELLVHEALEGAFALLDLGREGGAGPTGRAHIGDAAHAFGAATRFGDDVVDHDPDLRADQLAQLPAALDVGVAGFDRAPALGHEGVRQQLVEIEEACVQAIVDIVIVIGDVIGNRRHLRLERRPGRQLERPGLIDLGQRPVHLPDGAVVLGQAFERFPGQIQAIVLAIGRFEARQGPQAMGVVIEPAMRLERGVERILAGVAERRMADVMRQRQCFGQVLVEAQRPRDDAGDLRHLEAVGQADAIVIAIGRDEHLRLVAQPAEGDRMDDPVTIALIVTARPTREIARQRELPPARERRIGGERGTRNHRRSSPTGGGGRRKAPDGGGAPRHEATIDAATASGSRKTWTAAILTTSIPLFLNHPSRRASRSGRSPISWAMPSISTTSLWLAQ